MTDGSVDPPQAYKTFRVQAHLRTHLKSMISSSNNNRHASNYKKSIKYALK